MAIETGQQTFVAFDYFTLHLGPVCVGVLLTLQAYADMSPFSQPAVLYVGPILIWNLEDSLWKSQILLQQDLSLVLVSSLW